MKTHKNLNPVYGISFIITLALVLQLSISSNCTAQTISLKKAPVVITIDGNSDEWGNTLPYTNDKAKLSYTMSNDNDNLYLVIKTNDLLKQRDIVGAGITWSINVKGKERSTYSVTFPTAGPLAPRVYKDMDTVKIKESISQMPDRKILAKGFKDIVDEQIKTVNPYNIKTAIGYDDAGYLVYEAALPLTLLHATDITNEWAFNIKINGLSTYQESTTVFVVKANNSYSGSTTTSSNGRTKNPSSFDTQTESSKMTIGQPQRIKLTEPVDFWGKFILAK